MNSATQPASSGRPGKKRGVLARLGVSLTAVLMAASLAAVSGPGSAGAQPEPFLVSNLGKTDGSTASFTHDHAQAFLTGPNPDGYRVFSVDIEFASTSTGDISDTQRNNRIIGASIREDAGGIPGEINNGVGALTLYENKPASNSDHTIRINAHAGSFDLKPNKTYWLLLDVHGWRSPSFAKIRTTSDLGEDSGGQNGFQMARSYKYRTGGQNSGVEGQGAVNEMWSTAQDRSLKIRVNGQPAPPKAVASSVLPGLEFDTTQLGWDENAGCGTKTHSTSGRFLTGVSGNHGPTWNVRLTQRPFDNVDVLVHDPDDYPGTKHDHPEWTDRLIVENSGESDRTRLRFTAYNWNEWQTVKAKVACSAGTGDASVPVMHRMESNQVRNGVVRRAYPNAAEADAQQWNVWIAVTDSGGGQGADYDDMPLPAQAAPAQTAPAQAAPAEEPEPSCVSDSLLADVQGYAGETWRKSPGHVERWQRVLAAFGEDNSHSANPMTAAEAQTYADRGLPRWVPTAAALECVENTADEQPEAQADDQPAQEPAPPPPPPPTPQVSIAAGADIAEGADATFTVTATPAPASDLDVTVDVTQDGGYASAGSRTVTIGTSGSVTFVVATDDDSVDEADGSVTATVADGAGYTVSAAQNEATVAVADDDDPPAPAEDTSDSGTTPTGPPTVTVSDAVAVEGSEELRFSVTLSHANPHDIPFRYGSYGRTATYGQDFLQTYQPFVLEAGDTAIDVVVPVVDDSDPENDETLTVYVYATEGIRIPDYFVYADGTITDDD